MHDTESDKPTDRTPRSYAIFLWSAGLVGFAVVCGLVGAYSATFSGGIDADQATWALFGDFFGGVGGPVLSLIALAAVA